jgi:hypothetical protein
MLLLLPPELPESLLRMLRNDMCSLLLLISRKLLTCTYNNFSKVKREEKQLYKIIKLTSETMPPTRSTFLPSGPGEGEGGTGVVGEGERAMRGSRVGDLSCNINIILIYFFLFV